MKEIHVLEPGFLTSIQDLGRFGYAHLGVSASGAADSFALRIGNLLVGNKEEAAGLEMTLTGGLYEFAKPCSVAITGSHFSPRLNSSEAPMWRAFNVAAGQRLKIGATQEGARCYLCIQGGFDLPLTLGSYSTHLMTSLGGCSGRALRKGDVLKVRSSAHALVEAPSEDFSSWYQRNVLRVTAGLQEDFFSKEEIEIFYASSYEVAEDSNRMGLRLLGPQLKHVAGSEIVTEGAPLGAVQVPQNGKPIILFVEHQTTGGYPKIANIISADMHRVGQLRPRDVVRFRKVSLEEARAAFFDRERLVNSIRQLIQ